MDAHDNVETLLVLQPILVDTGSPDRAERLVLANGLLLVVMVRLHSPEHGVRLGWFVEAAFGRLVGISAAIFDTLEEGPRWLGQHRKP
ncbi:hypothetical protein MKK64_05495 [Methylobacterium sp. E-025]|uniref:hypothetical protein n=1 Tax=Methylobacterium sp. E-025 TaxID=2836561 RepID=UPI001FBAD343|nr:hypothetical protein [Methylobacterium sp. E-025]MCJ2110659.1 hypothetical protein [Methylobacterium sp. E-025]